MHRVVSQPIPMNRIKEEQPYASKLLRPKTEERPGSALARGVQITEYADPRVNPEPISMEETDLLLEEYLSPRKLRALTGVEDLDEVHFLEMKVDTTETSLGNFGSLLHNLSQLKLSNSNIVTVRDLGSSLTNLKVLWMARCCLENIDGIFSMSNLRELYLAYNELSDISPCSMLETVQIIDLEGNNIDDVSQVEFLALCGSLTNLTLEGNPICVTPRPDTTSEDYDYRLAVKHAVPHLKYLDDEPLTEAPASSKQDSSVFEEDWRLLDELMQEGSVPLGSTDSIDSPGNSRPVTALRPLTSYRPGTTLRPNSAARRMGTAGRPGSAARPTTGRPGSSESGGAIVEDASSGLTQTGADIVCGNPSKALRARKPAKEASPLKDKTATLFQKLRHHPEHTYDEPLDDEDAEDILSELQAWKLQNQSRKKKIETERAPQVLTIDYDDAVELSDDDDDEVLSDEDDPVTDRTEIAAGSQASRVEGSEVGADSIAASRISVESGVDMNYDSPQQSPYSPHTPPGMKSKGNEIRRRRIRVKSQEKDLQNVRQGHLQHDESFDAQEDSERSCDGPLQSQWSSASIRSQSEENVRLRSPVMMPRYEEGRPISGPAAIARNHKFRLDPPADKIKSQAKVIDKSRPVIRTLVHTPEKLMPAMPDALRHSTARAAVNVPTMHHPLRRGLGGVATLPSRPTVPK